MKYLSCYGLLHSILVLNGLFGTMEAMENAHGFWNVEGYTFRYRPGSLEVGEM